MRKHSTPLPHSAITILFQLERNRSTNICGRGSDISLKLTRFCRPSANSFIIELQIIRSDGESYIFFFTRCQSNLSECLNLLHRTQNTTYFISYLQLYDFLSGNTTRILYRNGHSQRIVSSYCYSRSYRFTIGKSRITQTIPERE